MRSQNSNRGNRNRSGNKSNSYSGSRNHSYSESRYGYNDSDRGNKDRERSYDPYDRSESDRYSNYEGNFGRGNYENRYDDRDNYSRTHNSSRYGSSGSNGGSTYNTGGRYATDPGSRNWDSQEPGYYSRSDNDERRYSDYGGTRRRDEKNWAGGDGRNYASEYTNDGGYRHDEERGFLGRVGDRIRDTWHDITDRDDTRDNMRRFNQSGGYNSNDGRDSSNHTYNNRGNYRPYPEGSNDAPYGKNTWSDNNNRGAYGERRNEYGGYGADRQEFNW